jgi:DNA-binding transcriptional LysR family regulator
MPRHHLNDLSAFVAVARERSFTKAAAKLGVSQSALSHTIRGLEERLGLRLLTRTTRSVAPTQAGERLYHSVGPRFAEIEAEVAALSELRDKPGGAVRITAGEHAANTTLWPAFAKVLPNYPDIKVEITVDYGLTDIVAERYDAGVRLGEQIAKDMIAVRIGPDLRMAVVGSRSYFERRKRPQTPRDLTAHECINLRLLYGRTPRSQDLDLPTCRRIRCRLTSPRGAWCVFWPTGVRPFRDITSIIPVAANLLPRSRSWSKHCVIAASEAARLTRSRQSRRLPLGLGRGRVGMGSRWGRHV